MKNIAHGLVHVHRATLSEALNIDFPTAHHPRLVAVTGCHAPTLHGGPI